MIQHPRYMCTGPLLFVFAAAVMVNIPACETDTENRNFTGAGGGGGAGASGGSAGVGGSAGASGGSAGAGGSSECTASSCPGVDDECKTRTCTGQTCGFAYAMAGTNCNQTGTCDGSGVCKLGNGSLCTLASQCFSGNCADDVCCDSACSGTCKACNVTGMVGTCSNVAFGVDDANGAPTCSGSAVSCDGAGVCKKEYGQNCGPNSDCLTGVCDGKCTGNSCNGSASSKSCGPSSNENCCTSNVVTGGTYNRSNDPLYPATVADFRLDRFEITVGRFRKFVEAYPASKPASGAGAHPLIAGSGWNSAWDTNLPADQAALKTALAGSYGTWTDTVGSNEHLPINRISWYESFAFCAWDGGRLPTEAVWNYAAAGGDDQREYPWSNPPSSTTVDATYAVYRCLGDGSPAGTCGFPDMLNVGMKSTKGDGKWGQADLGGSMWEFNLDLYQSPYANPCNNCANISQGANRATRGNGWYGVADNTSDMLSSFRSVAGPANRDYTQGARCAR